jgi:hypothetical protein
MGTGDEMLVFPAAQRHHAHVGRAWRQEHQSPSDAGKLRDALRELSGEGSGPRVLQAFKRFAGNRRRRGKKRRAFISRTSYGLKRLDR